MYPARSCRVCEKKVDQNFQTDFKRNIDLPKFRSRMLRKGVNKFVLCINLQY